MTQHVLRCALSAMLVALSVPAEAQPPQHMPRIGYLAARPADREQSLLPIFLHGLRELGYTEGKNIVIERRYAAPGQHDRVRDLAAELVRLPVDVMVVSDGVEEMQAATSAVPASFRNWPPSRR